MRPPRPSESPRRLGAVDAAARESTRFVPAQGIHVVVDPKAERLQIAERAELESLREMVRLLKSEGGASHTPDEIRVLQKALTKAEKNHRKDTALLRKTIDALQAKNDALTKRCDVLRLALPPAAAEAAESQLPVDDDVHIGSIGPRGEIDHGLGGLHIEAPDEDRALGEGRLLPRLQEIPRPLDGASNRGLSGLTVSASSLENVERDQSVFVSESIQDGVGSQCAGSSGGEFDGEG